MNCTLIPFKWEGHTYCSGSSWIFPSILGSGIIPGGKENDRARQSVFCTALNPFGKDPEEEPRNFDYNIPQEQLLRHIGNAIKMRYFQ